MTCVWIQGGWENDESMEQAAVRESIEEAGVVGNVEVRICNFPFTFCYNLPNINCTLKPYPPTCFVAE